MDAVDLPHLPVAAAAGVALLAAGLLAACEAARPLRRRVEAAWPHAARNVATFAVAQAVATPLRWLLVLPLAAHVRDEGWGLLGLVALPPAVEILAGIVLMDATLWVWHVLNHRVPVLWRFHAAHHADLDLDASTALRFHFGELALAMPWRAAQVLCLGVGPGLLAAWELLTLVATLFHHSNLRLPARLDRALAQLLPTPRMHGIHHSVERDERDSNYGVLLSLWDRVAGTLRLDVPQERVVIGLPGHQDPAELRFLGVQRLPFRASQT